MENGIVDDWKFVHISRKNFYRANYSMKWINPQVIMSGNFDYVTYRPLNADVREDVGPEVADDDDDALLDVDATDVLNSRDLTLRMDTEDESDHGDYHLVRVCWCVCNNTDVK